MLTTKKPSHREEGFDHQIRDPKGGVISCQHVGIIEEEDVFNWQFPAHSAGYTLEKADVDCSFRIEAGEGKFACGDQIIHYPTDRRVIRVRKGTVYGFTEVSRDTIAQETRELVKQ